MRLPEKVLELVVFSKKQTETLFIHISLEQGRLKIQKPFTHAKNVIIYFYRASKKYATGDPIPLKRHLMRLFKMCLEE